MLKREAVRWEQRYLGRNRLGDSQARQSTDHWHPGGGNAVFEGQAEQTGEGASAPQGPRRDEFPLLPFLNTGCGFGSKGDGSSRHEQTGPDLPELVREELLHRFVVGEGRTV